MSIPCFICTGSHNTFTHNTTALLFYTHATLNKIQAATTTPNTNHEIYISHKCIILNVFLWFYKQKLSFRLSFHVCVVSFDQGSVVMKYAAHIDVVDLSKKILHWGFVVLYKNILIDK